MRKKIFAVVGAGALALSLASCSGDADNSVTTFGSEPETMLIPAMVNEVGGGHVLDLIYEGLTRYDVDGKTVLAAAESIETNDAGKTWNVKLKADKVFSDGSPVTAQNFVDAWNWGADPANAANSAIWFAPIEGYPETDDEGNLVGEYNGLTGLEVVSDTEFNITLTEADPEFDQQLGYSAFYPLPAGSLDSEEALKKQGETEPVTNGPYILKEWKHGEKISLVPNEKYNGDIPAQNDGITFVMYTDDAAAYNDLLAGNLDVLDSIPADAISTFEDELGDRAINQPGAVWHSITIPYYLEHFGNDEEGRLRRQAISMAINREEIITTLFNNTRSPATDFVADVIPGHSESIEGNEVLQYNPEKAKELWEQANEISDWGDATFEIAFNPEASAHKAWIEAVTNQLKNNLGIKAEVKNYPDFKTLREDADSGKMTSALRTGWQADYPSAYNFMFPLYTKDAGANDSHYDNPDFDAALAEAHSKTDAAERAAGYDAAQAILMRDLPVIPMWSSKVTGGYSDKVDNVEVAWNTVPVYQNITK